MRPSATIPLRRDNALTHTCQYLKSTQKIPQLSASEERDLFAKFRGGDRWASELLILSQLKFVISIARNYRRDGCPLPDLIQEGTLVCSKP